MEREKLHVRVVPLGVIERPLRIEEHHRTIVAILDAAGARRTCGRGDLVVGTDQPAGRLVWEGFDVRLESRTQAMAATPKIANAPACTTAEVSTPNTMPPAASVKSPSRPVRSGTARAFSAVTMPAAAADAAATRRSLDGTGAQRCDVAA